MGYFLRRFVISPAHERIIISFMIFLVLFTVAYIFCIFLQCDPLAAFWLESPRAPGKCWSDTVILTITITAGIGNTIADWTFGLLPYFVVRTMRLPRRTKMLVIGILGIAAVYVNPAPLPGENLWLLTHSRSGSSAAIVRAVHSPSLLHANDFLCK